MPVALRKAAVGLEPPPITGRRKSWRGRPIEGTSGVEGTGSGGLEGVGGAQSPNFGSQLTNAISSLESTQRSADSAAQSLASGTATDPESAVVTVQDAQMAMDLAATIRTKATEAAQSIFQTQV